MDHNFDNHPQVSLAVCAALTIHIRKIFATMFGTTIVSPEGMLKLGWAMLVSVDLHIGFFSGTQKRRLSKQLRRTGD